MSSTGKGPRAAKTAPWLAAAGVSLLATAPAIVATTIVATTVPAHAAPPTELPAPAGMTTIYVAPGKRVAIPLPDVKRILPDDHEIVRGTYDNGRAVLEGVTQGRTYVQVVQGNNKRTMFAVQVDPKALENVVAAPPTRIAENSPAASITPVTTTPQDASTSEPVGTLSPNTPNPSIVPASASRSNLAVSLRVSPVEGNPFEALFTVQFQNRGSNPARDVKVRFVLADAITYVTNSATGGGQWDPAARALVWSVGQLPAEPGARTVSFRVAPIDRPQSFHAVATIEDASDVVVTSNSITYGFTKSALLTVFALPDRILAGRQGAVLTDVKTPEAQASIDRLQKLGVVSGPEPGRFKPEAEAQRAEYAVMTLRGLNLRDLRDVTAIKFVLAQPARVTVSILNSLGRQVAPIVKDKAYKAGEHTEVWDGTSPAGYVAPGRYSYVCTARTANNQTTTLRGYITVMPQTPLQPVGRPSFVDVKPSDWYAGYLAVAEKQNLVQGFPDKSFRPMKPINRVEATAIIVRSLGLEDAALKLKNQDATFLDYQNIPNWAVPYVNIATQLRTANGKTLVRGVPGNLYLPLKNLRRDEAALLVHRMIDNNRVQRITISGAIEAGATVTINNQTVVPNPDGQFSLIIVPDNAPASMAVIP